MSFTIIGKYLAVFEIIMQFKLYSKVNDKGR